MIYEETCSMDGARQWLLEAARSLQLVNAFGDLKMLGRKTSMYSTLASSWLLGWPWPCAIHFRDDSRECIRDVCLWVDGPWRQAWRRMGMGC